MAYNTNEESATAEPNQTTDATAEPNQTTDTRAKNEMKDSYKDEPRKILFKILEFMIFSSFLVFILFPALCILLSAVWPDRFNGSEILSILVDGTNSFVGLISLFVGLISIGYAFQSSHTMEIQTEAQRRLQSEILKSLNDQNEMLNRIERKSKKIKQIKEFLKDLNTRDLNYARPNSGDKAQEESGSSNSSSPTAKPDNPQDLSPTAKPDNPQN